LILPAFCGRLAAARSTSSQAKCFGMSVVVSAFLEERFYGSEENFPTSKIQDFLDFFPDPQTAGVEYEAEGWYL
jgi:hypothetical protein